MRDKAPEKQEKAAKGKTIHKKPSTKQKKRRASLSFSLKRMPSIGGYHLYGLSNILTVLESNRACVGYALTDEHPPTPPTYLRNFEGIA
ncbi:hypothetical protein TNCV_3631011 [Trichonephila clavipes]|nr:hypothetical protein TNCV_3631011 [Trichonephila clavipes]